MLELIPMLTDTGAAGKTTAVMGSVDGPDSGDDAEVLPDRLCNTGYRITGQTTLVWFWRISLRQQIRWRQDSRWTRCLERDRLRKIPYFKITSVLSNFETWGSPRQVVPSFILLDGVQPHGFNKFHCTEQIWGRRVRDYTKIFGHLWSARLWSLCNHRCVCSKIFIPASIVMRPRLIWSLILSAFQ